MIIVVSELALGALRKSLRYWVQSLGVYAAFIDHSDS